MAQPPNYAPVTNFSALTSFSATTGEKIDVELSLLKSTLDAVLNNMAILQRDDTQMANSVVHPYAITAATLALFAATWNPRGAWVTLTVYAVNDTVETANITYLCAVGHTSGIFNTDYATNHYWMAISKAQISSVVDAQITTGAANTYAFSSLNGNLVNYVEGESYLLRINSTNTGPATINRDGLGAKAANMNGAPMTGGEFRLDTYAFVTYNSSTGVYDLVSIPSQKLRTLSEQVVDYTITANDVRGVCELIVPVDSTAGNITVTLPAAGDYDGTNIRVVETTGTNKVIINNSAGTERWTCFAVRDFVLMYSDGTNERIVDSKVTDWCDLRLTADESIALASWAKIFDVSYSIESNVSGAWSSANHRWDAPFNCDIDVGIFAVTASTSIIGANIKVNGTPLVNHATPLYSVDSAVPRTHNWKLRLTKNDYIEFEIYNVHATLAQSISGAAAKDETRAWIKLEGRL